MMKGIKNSHEQHRIVLRQKYAAFRSQLLLTNQLCLECGLTNENLIPYNSIHIPEWLADKPNILPNMIIPSSAVMAAAAAAANSSNLYYSSSSSSRIQSSSAFRTPFSNYFFPPQQPPPSISIANLQPRPFGTFLEDISKLKVRLFFSH
uniref:Uncharacterized protein n=1 Tax=Panagrolaimus sp. PS1159 TaxID=55785 RepID=A0AC35F7Z1_9BILA